MAPGELFVHRNVANLAPPQDANYLSVLQFVVDVLKVKHVLVVGHYGCGGVAAAVDGKRRGLVDHWLHPIREVAYDHEAELATYVDERERLNRLCELNVVRQVRNVASDVFVEEAWARGQPLSVHGWVYSLSSGLVTDLGVTVPGPISARLLEAAMLALSTTSADAAKRHFAAHDVKVAPVHAAPGSSYWMYSRCSAGARAADPYTVCFPSTPRRGNWSSRFAVPSSVPRGAMIRTEMRDAWRGEYGPS
jgi:carbonic anhydrase